MKKLIALVLALVCVLGLIGCGTLTSAQDTSANSVLKEDALMKVTQFMMKK